MSKRKEILNILQNNAKITHAEIAIMLGITEDEARSIIKDLENDNVIFGYKTLIDWEKTDSENVSALIELKVTPQIGEGFDSIAERIMLDYPEVLSVNLMSGGYDILVEIEGKSMKEVALFVAEKIAPMDYVLSTATHFVLRKYKQDGIVLKGKNKDERSVISL